MKSTHYLIAFTLVFALASCAGPQSKPTAPAKEKVENVEPEVVAHQRSAFHKLDQKQRAEFMKTEIMPKMTKVFQAFDTTHFANVTCMTCHGPGAKEGKFEMPTAALPKLDFSKKDPKHEKWNAFMSAKVVPAMATALGEKPFDPATQKGFGCFSCHMKASK